MRQENTQVEHHCANNCEHLAVHWRNSHPFYPASSGVIAGSYNNWQIRTVRFCQALGPHRNRLLNLGRIKNGILSPSPVPSRPRGTPRLFIRFQQSYGIDPLFINKQLKQDADARRAKCWKLIRFLEFVSPLPPFSTQAPPFVPRPSVLVNRDDRGKSEIFLDFFHFSLKIWKQEYFYKEARNTAGIVISKTHCSVSLAQMRLKSNGFFHCKWNASPPIRSHGVNAFLAAGNQNTFY